MTLGDMTKPVAVITGGGTGIGAATATRLARAGWNLALAGRRKHPLDTAAAACRDASPGCDALAVSTDITDLEQCLSLIEAVDHRFARIDALINNAGGGPIGPAATADPAEIAASIAINATGPAWLIRLAWPIFARQGGGCVVNVSSVAAHDPFPGLFAYAAGKAACESMIRSIHNERGDLALRAFAVAPGAVETDLLREYFDETVVPRNATMTPDSIAAVIADCVLGRRDADAGSTILIHNSDHPPDPTL